MILSFSVLYVRIQKLHSMFHRVVDTINGSKNSLRTHKRIKWPKFVIISLTVHCQEKVATSHGILSWVKQNHWMICYCHSYYNYSKLIVKSAKGHEGMSKAHCKQISCKIQHKDKMTWFIPQRRVPWRTFRVGPIVFVPILLVLWFGNLVLVWSMYTPSM